MAEISSADKWAIYSSLISFFSRHQYLFLFLFYRIVVSWLSYSVSAWRLGQHVCCFSAAIAHLSIFWCFGNLQNHPVAFKIYTSLLIANRKSVLNIESRRHPTELHLKTRPYKVILGLQVHFWQSGFIYTTSLSWQGTTFFPRVRRLWIRCYLDVAPTLRLSNCTLFNNLWETIIFLTPCFHEQPGNWALFHYSRTIGCKNV